MVLFLIKNKSLFSGEDVKQFPKLMELVLLLTCLKYEMFYEFKQEVKAKETAQSLKEKLWLLLKEIFEDDEDAGQLLTLEWYPAEEENDEGNSIKLSDPL